MKITFKWIAILLFWNFSKLTSQIPNYIPQDSLMGYYTFDGTMHNKVSYPGEPDVYNEAYTLGKHECTNNALKFTDSTYLRLPQSSYYDRFTFSVWMSFDEDQFSKKDLVNIFFPSSHSLSLALKKHTNPNYGNLFLKISNSDTLNLYNWSIYMHQRHFKFITLTGNSGVPKVYLDGKLISQTQHKYLYIDTFLKFNTWDWTSKDFHFRGAIQTIGYWNRTLSDDEVQTIYDSTAYCRTIQKQPFLYLKDDNKYILGVKAIQINATYQWQQLDWIFSNLSDTLNTSGTKTESLTILNPNEAFKSKILACRISDDFCCNLSDTFSILGIDFNSHLKQQQIPGVPLNAFPNPTQSDIAIPNLTEGSVYQLFNSSGKLIIESEYAGNIPFKPLNPGIYYIKTQHQTLKIIKY
jgi:hypothetical protein